MICFYWAVTTMSTIGYGDIGPGNTAERMYCIVCEVIGAFVFAYGITTMCNIIANLSVRTVAFRRCVHRARRGRLCGGAEAVTRQFASLSLFRYMDELDEYMKFRDVPHQVKVNVRRYVHFQKTSTTGCFFEEDQLLSGLSRKLRTEVLEYAYAEVLGENLFFEETHLWLDHSLLELHLLAAGVDGPLPLPDAGGGDDVDLERWLRGDSLEPGYDGGARKRSNAARMAPRLRQLRFDARDALKAVMKCAPRRGPTRIEKRSRKPRAHRPFPLLRYMEGHVYAPGDRVISGGRPNHRVYLITDGCCEEVVMGKVCNVYGPNDYFGAYTLPSMQWHVSYDRLRPAAAPPSPEARGSGLDPPDATAPDSPLPRG